MLVHCNVRQAVLSAVLLALISPASLPGEEPKEAAANPGTDATRQQPKITVSKETTYITGPLRDDGYVDYAAAMNQRCSAGVTPENNAAIPFWQAVGPKSIDKKIRGRYFELLGIPELPEEGPYLLKLDVFRPLHKGDGAEKQFEQAGRGPWSREEHLLVAAFLEKNEKALAILVDGVQLTRFYSPAIPVDGDSLAHIELTPGLSEAREAVKQLTARAMLRLGGGDNVGAWRDILACHRFARLYGQRPLLVDRLVAMALDSMATSAAVALAQQAAVTAGQAREFQSQLRVLLPLRPMKDVWDNGERLYSLDCLLDIAVNKDRAIAFKTAEQVSWLYNEENKRELKALKSLVGERDVDWNEALRLENVRFNRLVEAMEQPTISKRLEMVAHLEEDSAKAAQVAAEQVLASSFLGIGGSAAPAVKAQRLIDIWHGPGPLGSMGSSLAVAEERFGSRNDLAILAFALAGYRNEHHNFPHLLNELEPNYIDAVPKDRFTGGELHYRLVDDGYLLYSVGPNGKDDGGRNHLQEQIDGAENESATEEEKSRDDIAIRTPPEKIEKK